MTPFMLRVQDLLDGQSPAAPTTELSPTGSVAQAAHAQVMVRSLAEQLVSEANALLRDHGDVIDLVDDSGPGELAFRLSYADRSARVQTVISGRSALATLSAPGLSDDGPRRLTSEEEVEALLLTLLAPPVLR